MLGDHRLVDRDQAVVEHQPVLLPLLDGRGECFEHMVVDMAADRVQLALPEGFEDHPVGRLGALEEAGDVERRVGGKQRAHAWPRGRQERHVAAVGRDRLRRRGLGHARLDPGIGVGGLQNRLLLMARALSEHAVKAQSDEQSDEREDDDNGQLLVLTESSRLT